MNIKLVCVTIIGRRAERQSQLLLEFVLTEAGRLVCPFDEKIESKLSHYLVCKQSDAEKSKIIAFRDWMLAQVDEV